MDKTVCIYGLRDPRDGVIKYVGKTKDLEARLKDHLKDAKCSNTPKNAWLLKLERLGLNPVIVMLEEVPVEEWEQAERKWIADLRMLGARLKNICDGGEGRNGPLSEEAKRNVSIGLRNSERFRIAMKVAGKK